MLPEIIIVIVGIIISLLIFSWGLNILKTTLSTALIIIIILFFCQFLFNINYQDILQGIQQFIRQLVSYF